MAAVTEVGAEATVRPGTFLGLAVMEKVRLAKEYRVAELDQRIRRERTRQEALLLYEASAAGVPVPRVLDVDLAASTLRIEHVEGALLRNALDEPGSDRRGLCMAFGRLVGDLHRAGLIHGDLTTSNVIVHGDRLVLIDFGLAHRSPELEDRGVDLHLVERTFESSHPGGRELFPAFLDGYRERLAQAQEVEERMIEIKGRARYA